MALARIKKGDLVLVISGDQRPVKVKDKLELTTGKVLKVLPKQNKAIVEGVNLVWQHKRRSQKHPKGARIQVEAPVALSKLKLICQSCNNPTKPRTQRTPEGDKIRICRRCGKPVSVE
jgi:large subunit ribosomal protein L24